MSTYYCYYIGYKKGTKVYPLGPFTSFNEFVPVVDKSRSFASPLWRDFSILPEENMSKALKKRFTYGDGDQDQVSKLFYLPLNSLPDEDPIKKGYFLIKDVNEYENGQDVWELFGDRLSPEAYSGMVANEEKFGKPKPVVDEFGQTYTPPTASDYMYYSYYDPYSIGSEVSLLRQVARSLITYDTDVREENIVIILDIC